MIPRIVWLASYPKSGNTWVRVFLSNLTQEAATPVDVNNLTHSAINSDRRIFDQVLGFETGDLDREHCARLRPVAYRWMNAQLTEPLFCKAHDACDCLDNGDWLMAPDATDKVIYIMRNPLDVAVSMANFNRQSLDEAIAALGNPDAHISRQTRDKQKAQVEQRLGTWSGHVESWTQNALFQTCIVRYEDLSATPERTFAEITTFLGLPQSDTQRTRAIENASFDGLQAQERASGFRERPTGVSSFFRQGRVGDWKAHLTRRQIDKVVEDHLPVMQQFGYVDRDGTPQFL